MTAREKMIAWRESHQSTFTAIAKKIKISEALLDLVENGHVTHPNIARRIQKFYNLTDSEYEELIPKNYREDSYDPTQYAPIDDPGFNKTIPAKIKSDIYYHYVHDQNHHAEGA